MLRLNKYLFFEVCDKNLENYNNIINTIKKEYFKIIDELSNQPECSVIRKLIHKLAGTISVLEGSNREVIYIIKSMLTIDKDSNDLESYKFYINMLMNLNTDYLF